jgi:hypothetical protein
MSRIFFGNGGKQNIDKFHTMRSILSRNLFRDVLFLR